MGSPLSNGFRKFLCANTTLSLCSVEALLLTLLLRRHTFYHKERERKGERKEGRKERGRKGRKVRSQPLGSAETLHYEKEIEKLGMRNHSLHEVIALTDKESRRVFSSVNRWPLPSRNIYFPSEKKEVGRIKNLPQAFKTVFSKDLLKRFLSPFLETNAGLAENSCIRFTHPGDNNLMSRLCRAHPLSQMSSTT